MKKILLPLLAAALLVCSCEKETVDPNNPADTNVQDTTNNPIGDPAAVETYVGTYTIVRTADLNVNVPVAITSLNFPIQRELEAETAIVAPDITREGGLVITGNKGTVLRGVATANGLQLDRSTLSLDIDTTVSNYHLAGAVEVALDHPANIAAPAQGLMEWTSAASGTAVFNNIPVVGSLSGTLGGTVRFTATKQQND